MKASDIDHKIYIKCPSIHIKL